MGRALVGRVGGPGWGEGGGLPCRGEAPMCGRSSSSEFHDQLCSLFLAVACSEGQHAHTQSHAAAGNLLTSAQTPPVWVASAIRRRDECFEAASWRRSAQSADVEGGMGSGAAPGRVRPSARPRPRVKQSCQLPAAAAPRGPPASPSPLPRRDVKRRFALQPRTFLTWMLAAAALAGRRASVACEQRCARVSRGVLRRRAVGWGVTRAAGAGRGKQRRSSQG